jgi:hypothetical protein
VIFSEPEHFLLGKRHQQVILVYIFQPTESMRTFLQKDDTIEKRIQLLDEDDDEEDIDMDQVLLLMTPLLSKALGKFVMILGLRYLYKLYSQ